MTDCVVGWDIGGAHLKACLRRDGRTLDVAQWPCPLWRGLEHLEQALDAAARRWPLLAQARHGITMTGEMTDLFADRADGVTRIAACLARRWRDAHCYAGDAGWVAIARAGAHWADIASANWLATACHVARSGAAGVLIDIGSTTTDLIAFRAGRVLCTARSDFARLASGALVYQGVVRTPLCALAPRVPWRGQRVNVMHEFFATTADVYRLTGELDAAHDQHASADDGGKDAVATRRRLARMIGLDQHDGQDADWLALAQTWRALQIEELAGQLARVLAESDPGPQALAVSAGCGAFLVPALCARVPRLARCLSYARDVARVDPHLAAWAEVCAPAVAVAALYDEARPA